MFFSFSIADLPFSTRLVSSLSVVDTHPTSLVSLRLDQPFPSLLAYANSINFETLDSMDHGNVPFVLIIIRALEEWRANVSSLVPFARSFPSLNSYFLSTARRKAAHLVWEALSEEGLHRQHHQDATTRRRGKLR